MYGVGDTTRPVGEELPSPLPCVCVWPQEQELVEEQNQEISSWHDQKEQLELEAKQTRAELARLEDQISQLAVEDAKVSSGLACLELTSLLAEAVGHVALAEGQQQVLFTTVVRVELK